jgi:hypothetical protein
MQQEASEGHRLLTRAYRKDGSLAPMATLSAFSAQHTRSWEQLRGRLPSQLGDVSDRVTSVFTAIRHDVAPLQGMLPPDARTGGSAAHPSGTPSGPATRRGRHAAPTASGDASPGDGSAADGKRDGTGRHRGAASPTPSQSTGSGLIGGSTGGLLPGTGSVGGGTGTGSGDGGTGDSTASPKPPAVTLPPLLPGLLPSLGLGVDDTGTSGG